MHLMASWLEIGDGYVLAQQVDESRHGDDGGNRQNCCPTSEGGCGYKPGSIGWYGLLFMQERTIRAMLFVKLGKGRL